MRNIQKQKFCREESEPNIANQIYFNTDIYRKQDWLYYYYYSLNSYKNETIWNIEEISKVTNKIRFLIITNISTSIIVI